MKYIRPDPDSLEWNLTTEPYPHIVVDNFLKDEYVQQVLDEMSDLHIADSYYHGHCTIEKNKYAFNRGFKATLSGIFAELNSDEFIQLLESKTGITDIIRNNLELHGAGIHKVLNEGFLCMHTDFEGYQDAQYGLLDRRINILLYMNPLEWRSEYGGELCLYDKFQQKITKRIQPILNRCVIFITPGNIHGHPKPLCLPQSWDCRQSITTYYYTRNTTGKNLQGEEMKPVQWYTDIQDIPHHQY
jgi:hypothetical protein